VDELAASLRTFEALTAVNFEPGDAIDAGAFVEARLQGGFVYFLLVPTAGGVEIQHEGMEITLLSPESPLYQKLLGMKSDESLEVPPLTITLIS
jgi:hypothetical protein